MNPDTNKCSTTNKKTNTADKSEMTTSDYNDAANYKYDRKRNCPHCNAFSLGENCNCCDSRTFECGTDVWENGTCRSAECYEREISSLSRVVENLQEILKDIRESV
jgi:hypothetical protein